MGLDLYLVRVKNNDLDGAEEITYGRKTWFISSFFEERSIDQAFTTIPNIDNDYYYEIPEEAVSDFYATFEPYITQFRYWLQYIEENHNDESRAIRALEDLYCVCLDLDNPPDFQCGIDWETRVLVSWLDQYFNLIQIFRDNDKLVMVRSY